MTPLWSDEVEMSVRGFFSMTPRGDMQVHNLPKTVQRCTRCVMTNQRPRIVFDDEGVCSACRYAEKKRTGIDWAKRADELKALLDRHRKPSGYDVIVPCSGGKDSAMVAHRLKHEHGMHPLCVKWAPHLYTDIGRKNLDAFIQSGFDVMVMHPNGLLHRRLSRLALEYVGDPFLPFIYGQLAYPMRMAAKMGINLVFYGENGEAEYGGDPSANDKPCWNYADWERVYQKGAGVDQLVGVGLDVGAFTDDEARSLSEFYRLPDIDALGGIEFHWFSYYRFWHPQENFYYASENTGFTPNPERSEGTYSKYASLDDKMDGLHYMFGYLKFGIGRCTSDAAHEVRDGDLTRDEALALVEKYDGEPPERHLGECLDYLGMDRARLDAVMERFRGPPTRRANANLTLGTNHHVQNSAAR